MKNTSDGWIKIGSTHINVRSLVEDNRTLRAKVTELERENETLKEWGKKNKGLAQIYGEDAEAARSEAERLKVELAEAKDEARIFWGMLDEINMIMYMNDRHALGQTDFDRQVMNVLERWAACD